MTAFAYTDCDYQPRPGDTVLVVWATAKGERARVGVIATVSRREVIRVHGLCGTFGDLRRPRGDRYLITDTPSNRRCYFIDT